MKTTQSGALTKEAVSGYGLRNLFSCMPKGVHIIIRHPIVLL